MLTWSTKPCNGQGKNAQAGEVIIISGILGDHGITVLATREGMGLDTDMAIGGIRLLDMLLGELLPRICYIIGKILLQRVYSFYMS